MSNIYLNIKKLNKTFGSGHSVVTAVNNISCSVSRGEIVLIMGPSGSGKTTLLMMIGALLTADSGQVFLGKQDIISLTKKEQTEIRATEIGFIFQSFNLLSSLNVWENIAVVLELIGESSKIAKDKAKTILDRLGLVDRLQYPIADLSGGEKQRVAVARALVTNPQIILADEPTANLDSASGHTVMELLKKIAKEDNKVVVVVSHDMRLMDIADRVLWLEDGKLKEGGTEFVTDPVCEMRLQQKLAPFSLKHEGQTYYFCSKKCLNEYEQLKKIL